MEERDTMLERVRNVIDELSGVVEAANRLEEQLGRIGRTEQTVVLIGENSGRGKRIGSAGSRFGSHVSGEYG